MRLPVSTSTTPLPVVNPSVHPLRGPSLSYAVPHFRNPLLAVTWIVALVVLLILLAMTVYRTAAWLIESQRQQAATAALDNSIRAQVQGMVNGGAPTARGEGESEDDFRYRRDIFVRLCDRVGVARPVR